MFFRQLPLLPPCSVHHLLPPSVHHLPPFLSARWVKFEEVVEEGGKRWSKPHVASLSMHAMLETRKMLMEGVLCLDLDVHGLAELVGMF